MKKHFLLLFLVISSIYASAQTVTIYRAGIATAPTYTNIKSAVAAAINNDSLVLSADTFKENMILVDKNLSITGTETSSIKSTIDATHDSTAIIFNNPDPLTIITLLIQHTDIINGSAHNGATKGGGAICADYNTVLTISDKSFLFLNEAGSSSPNGGAIFSSGQVIVRDSAQIKDNKASSSGGAIYYSGTGILYTCFITNNIANMGAGIYVNNGELYCLNKSLIKENAAKLQGGAIALINASFTMTDSVIIMNNTTDTNFGAGIYAKGNQDLYITGGQIVGNHATDTLANGLGMAIYNDSTGGGSSIVLINSTRVFNPKNNFSRQNEVYNIHPASAFISDSTWWGESDTSGLIYNGSGATVALRTWTVADWSVNAGTPVGTAISFPVEAYFRLNTGGALPPNFHWMLQGIFVCDSGKFTPTNPFMSSANIVGSVYNVPVTSNTAHIVASVDADTFKKNIWVIGLNINEQALNSSLKFNIYPNPSNGQITISASEKTMERFSVTVFDLLGKIVFRNVLESNTLKNELNINTQSGQYFLELKDKKGNMWREKIVVQ